MQYLLTTLGCKVNQYESSVLHGAFKALGWQSVSNIEAADVFVLNSCTVTENSDRKVRRLLVSARRRNPQAVTAVTGCFPQAYPEAAKILGADIICGVTERASLPRLIQEFINKQEAIQHIVPHSNTYEHYADLFAKSGRTRALLKIQDGCDNNCAYCIVPQARGRPRSRLLEDIRGEAKAARAAGFKELVLTGINLTKHEDLCGAVNTAAEYTERIRLSSVEPDLLTDEIINELAKYEKLCPHFHLSLQSGSDSVLMRMNRRYTSAEYYKKIQTIRSLFKGAEFTTDMIVGFPGETQQEFEESLQFAQSVRFSKIHVFPYSLRKGTAAAEIPHHVHDNIKRERCNILLMKAAEMRTEFLTSQIGQTLSVLTEKRTNSDEAFGHAKNYAPVKILNSAIYNNTIVNIKVTEANAQYCVGILKK